MACRTPSRSIAASDIAESSDSAHPPREERVGKDSIAALAAAARDDIGALAAASDHSSVLLVSNARVPSSSSSSPAAFAAVGAGLGFETSK
jgi:hypothetical protein